MPALESYDRDLPYSYAPGLFPCMEALRKRPELVRRVLLSSQIDDSQVLPDLMRLCAAHGIRVEQADRALSRISGKENTFAAAVFEKKESPLSAAANHLVLHQPSDKGNLGTILRTALGFGFRDIAIIRPAADYFDPHVIRASMGAMFSLNICAFDHFDAYRSAFEKHALYPFMLNASITLLQAAQSAVKPYALIFGNEGSGLPDRFSGLGQAVRIPQSKDIDSLNLSAAAAIGMYVFSQAGNPDA